jgi:hypothetical protein
MSTVTIYNSSINFSLSATGIPKSPRNRYLYHLDDDVNYSKFAFHISCAWICPTETQTETAWVCFWFCRPDRQFRSFSCFQPSGPSTTAQGWHHGSPPRISWAVFYSRRALDFSLLHVKATAPTYFRGAQFLRLQP